jgi:serine/threonine protein phosphatase PrpC
MLTASLQSTWDGQRGRQQRPKYGNAYQNGYNNNNNNGGGDDQNGQRESKGSSSGYGQQERSMLGKTNYSAQQSPYQYGRNGSSNDPVGHSELPNLKVPQMLNSRGGIMGAGASSPRGGQHGSNHQGLGSTAEVQAPVGHAMYPSGKKHRASSRQSNHKNRRQHNRYNGSNMDSYTGGSGGNSGSMGGPNVAQAQMIGSGAEQQQQQQGQLLPQIGSSGGAGGGQLPSAGGGKKRGQMYMSAGNGGNGGQGQAQGQGQAMVASSGSGGAGLGAPLCREYLTGNVLFNTEEHNHASCASIRGLKPNNPNWNNQDSFFIQENFEGRDIRIYCVLDGHGEHGHLVSRRARDTFPQFIKSSRMDIDTAFNMVQSDLNTSSDFDSRCSGATCVLATLVGGKLSVYNCGDSRAVVGRRNPNGSIYAVAMSKDHKPDRADERKRILSCGGHLGCRQALVNQPGRGPVSMPVGPCRVWYQHRGETLGLAMSRSLGDSIVHKSGVSAEPECMERMLDDYDDFLILATDGVWDVVDNNYAVQMVHSFASKSVNWNPLEAANSVARFARSRWEKLSPMIDDITCIVIKVHR